MAKRNAIPVNRPPNLVVSRSEAAQRIRAQIQRAREFQNLPIKYDDDLQKAEAERDRWCRYVTELLTRSFDNESLAIEFEIVHAGPSEFGVPYQFRRDVELKINFLESLLERLELIPELPPQFPPSSSNVTPDLQTKERNRSLMLNRLYDLTGGEPTKIVTLAELTRSLPLEGEAQSTFDYLEREGLAKCLAGSGADEAVVITHQGSKEVETAKEKPSETAGPSPANFVFVSGSQGVNVVTGAHQNVVQHAGPTLTEAIDRLEARLQELAEGGEARDVDRLVRALKTQPADKREVAEVAEAVAKKGSRWKEALQDFAAKVAADTAAQLIVQAIHFALAS